MIKMSYVYTNKTVQKRSHHILQYAIQNCIS